MNKTPHTMISLYPYVMEKAVSACSGYAGRPVDVLVANDGALLVSDDYNGAIYRISTTK